MKKTIYSIICTLGVITMFAQNNVGIGTTAPDPKAILELNSTDQGFLPPRLTYLQRLNLSTPIPAGLIIYCTDCAVYGELQVYSAVSNSWRNAVNDEASGGIYSNQMGSDIDGEAVDDRSGRSVSISADGTRVAIGSPVISSVRVFEWDGNFWNKMGLNLNGETAQDNFGSSVSISSDGNRLAVGATGNDGVNGSNSGHTRVFQWDGTAWNQMGADIDGEAIDDRSGISVSLSSFGTVLAVGADQNDDNGSNSGHVRIYDWDGTSWNQKGVDLDGEANNDRSGTSVSISANGNQVAIGAHLNDGNGSNSGHVRVYDWNGTNWAQLGSDINGEIVGDQSGRSVAIAASGTRIVIGATRNYTSSLQQGHARVYDWNGTGWVQFGPDINGKSNFQEQFGYSVAISADGQRIAVSSIRNAANGNLAGQVRVFQHNGTKWARLGPDINGEAAGDNSGYSVSLSADGGRVAIGAPQNDGFGLNAGHVRVFE